MFDYLKLILKKIILISYFRNIVSRIFGVNYKYRLSINNEIFDSIYLNKLWGGYQDSKKCLCSGTGSHDPKITEPYVKLLPSTLKILNL